jgi:hypothetical protein
VQRWGKSKISKEDKLKLIRSILNGNFDFDELSTQPRHYQVTQWTGEGTYTVHCRDHNEAAKEMTQEEYDQWHSTLRDCDVVFHVKFEEYRTNEPLQDESQLEAQHEAHKATRIERPIKETKPVKSKQNKPVIEQDGNNEVLKVDDNYFPMMPNSGKISEYGITWKLRNN